MACVSAHVRASVSLLFFQAEDGIRDLYVTGVQTCALPIFAAIEHAEARVEPQRPGVAPQQTIRNGVKCSRPWKPHILFYVAHDALSTADHFEGGSTRKGEKQNAIGACAFEHEMRHAVREGVCFSGSGAGDDQKRTGGIAAAEARTAW